MDATAVHGDPPSSPCAMMAAYAIADGAHRVRQGRGDARRRARRPSPPRSSSPCAIGPQAGADAFAARYGVAAFTDVATMVREAGVQAVSVCTPHPVHADGDRGRGRERRPRPRREAAGGHARRLRPGDRRVRGGRRPARRHQPAPVLPADRAHEGRDRRRASIGRPVLATVDILGWRDAAYYASNPWRGTWAGEGGGVLVNQAPHQLDLLQWLMGPVEELFGYWDNLNHPGDPGRRHGGRGRSASGAAGSASIVAEQRPEPGHRRPGPRPRLERGVDRDADRLRVDVHLRASRRPSSRRSTTCGRSTARPAACAALAGRGPGVRGRRTT